jgi:hypothetical protein
MTDEHYEELGEDVITCAGDHGAEPSPAVFGTQDASADEVADEAGWLDTDIGWLCPDTRHDGEQIMLYELTPGVEGSEIAICTSMDAVQEAVGWILVDLPEEGAAEVTIHVKRTALPLREVRAMISDSEEVEG